MEQAHLGPLYMSPGWTLTRSVQRQILRLHELGLGRFRVTLVWPSSVSFSLVDKAGDYLSMRKMVDELCNHYQFVLTVSAILPMLFACLQLHGFLMLVIMPSWRFFHALFTLIRLRHFPTSCTWERTLNRKKSDVQMSPGQMGQCLHEWIEEISTLLAWLTRVS